MNDLRIGVIGTGGRGGVARHAHKPGEGSRIVACCDTVDAHLEKGREKYGFDIFTTNDYRELLKQELDGSSSPHPTSFTKSTPWPRSMRAWRSTSKSPWPSRSTAAIVS